MALKGRLARWNARAWLGKLLAPDERVHVLAIESHRAGDVWVISTAATYINSKPSRAGRERRHDRNLRIPHAFVNAVAQSDLGKEAILTVIAVADGTSREYSGRFASADATQLASAISIESGVQVVR